ncbi:enolase C-terminal domain-like protein [Serratia fonticola]|uniref:enolase C-terminal domain-like protein n=1 Tax=Serratia fonticola TaxID=47917 RepID=UPI003F5F5905
MEFGPTDPVRKVLHIAGLTLDLTWGSEMFGPLLLKDNIIASPLNFANGQVALPNGPGLGIEIDEDKLRFYQRK